MDCNVLDFTHRGRDGELENVQVFMPLSSLEFEQLS